MVGHFSTIWLVPIALKLILHNQDGFQYTEPLGIFNMWLSTIQIVNMAHICENGMIQI